MRAAIAILAAVLLIAALAGCAPKSLDETATLADLAFPENAGGPSLTPEQHLLLGSRMADQGQGEAAFLHFQKALSQLKTSGAAQDDPRVLDLRAAKAGLMLAAGQAEAALSEYRAVLELRPEHVAANEGAGAVYLRSGLLDEAREHLERALASDASSWRAHRLLGLLASREGDLDRSLAELNAALDLAPNRAETLNDLGVTRMMRHEYAPALEAFRKALLAGAPKDRTYNNIGLTLARMGRRTEALEAFRYAGDEAGAYNNLGYALLLQGDIDEAVRCFERAVELSPSYYSKAFENLRQARMARSIRDAAPAPAKAEPAEPQTPAREPEASAPVSQRGDAPPKASPTLKARAEPASFEPAPATAPDASGWGFHLASFQEREPAEAEAARIASRGVASGVARVDLGDRGVWFRVLAGRFTDRDQAEAGRAAVAAALGLTDARELFIQSFGNPDRATPPARGVL